MSSQAFTAAYKKLNSAQKAAVDAIEGPVMVIAGPGTGKTQILTLRIANILRKTDTAPSSVLALTFTESAVFSMRRRLVEFLGADAYRVRIHTFHGFANEVIARFPDSFPRIIGSRNLSDVERVELVRALILELPLTLLRPFGDNFFYVRDVLMKIGEMKRENISPLQFAELLTMREEAFHSTDDLYNTRGPYKGQMKGKYASAKKRMEKDRELLVVYKAYEEKLRELKLYDYEDMLLEAIRALDEDRELLMTLQEEHQYILADEHQDANMSQNRLLELLASFHESPNLFIVGDEKQAVFRFQGASLENFLYFKRRFKDATTVTLTENYRSTQHILDTAHALIGRAEVGGGAIERVPLMARGEAGRGSITLASLGTPDMERAYIAAQVQKLIGEGVSPSDIAVLYRVNRHADTLRDALERVGIPVVVSSEQNILSDPDMRRFLMLVRALGQYGEDAALVPALHLDFLGLSPFDVSRLLAAVRREKVSLYELIVSTPLLSRAALSKASAVKSLAKQLSSWKGALHNRGLVPGLEIVARESGFASALVAGPAPYEKLGLLAALFSAAEDLVRARRDATAADLISYLDVMEEHGLSLKAPRNPREAKAVHLMTAHRAKGLEFPHVIIAHATDGTWGNRRERSYFSPIVDSDADGSLDDERRLFYVALTRARSSILITYARTSDTGTPLLPTQFLEELDKSLLETAATEAFEAAYVPGLSRLSPRAEVPLDGELVRRLFIEQGLSVTALNNYLSCPWKYFYTNLLRVPQAPDKHRSFGTAVHRALKEFFDLYRAGDDIGAAGLVERFVRAIEREPIPQREVAEARQKGERALPSFYQARHESFDPQGVAEFQITALLETSLEAMPRLRLRGDLDRIEFESSGRARVFDYKTGKRKTKGEIEGKGDSALLWGDYKRQIVFYGLLLSLYEGGAHPMSEGIIDFVEPDEKGRHDRAILAPSPEDIRSLTQELVRVSGEILSLSFASSRCDDRDCVWCRLRTTAAHTLGVVSKEKPAKRRALRALTRTAKGKIIARGSKKRRGG